MKRRCTGVIFSPLVGARFIGRVTADQRQSCRFKGVREARFPGVPWQRWQFNLQQNAGRYVAGLEMRREVAGDPRAIFGSGDRLEAERRLRQAVDKYAQRRLS